MHAWDEGWAFYAGSLEGEDGSGAGYMLHALADKRCINFGTCTGDDDGDDIAGTSAVNEEMLELFKQGLGKLQSSDCNGADSIKDKIVDLMTVPLMQGVLRCLYGGMHCVPFERKALFYKHIIYKSILFT